MKIFDNLFNRKKSEKDNSLLRKCNTCGYNNLLNAKFCAECGSEIRNIPTKFDAFISYRRENGGELASLIKVQLENKFHKQVFIDVKEIQVGKFDEALLNRIEETPNFILILSKASLDRCVNKSDWFKREIMHALITERNIIPIQVDGFTFPAEDIWKQLPDRMKELISLQAVIYSHLHQDASIRQIASYLKTEVNKFSKEKINDSVEFSEPEINENPQSNTFKQTTPQEKLSIYDYTDKKQSDLLNLFNKQLKNEHELQMQNIENGTEISNDYITLLNKHREQLNQELIEIHSVLKEYNPKNFVEAYVVCSLYLDISMNEIVNINQGIWLNTKMECFPSLSKEIALLMKKNGEANLNTWNNLKNFNVDVENATIVSLKNYKDSENIFKEVFSREYFDNHRFRVMDIDKQFKGLLTKDSVLDDAKSDSIVISAFQPLLNSYITEKISFERIVSNSNLVSDYLITLAKIAQLEINFSICYMSFSYIYHLLKEKNRIYMIKDILDINLNYIKCRDNWIKTKSGN